MIDQSSNVRAITWLAIGVAVTWGVNGILDHWNKPALEVPGIQYKMTGMQRDIDEIKATLRKDSREREDFKREIRESFAQVNNGISQIQSSFRDMTKDVSINTRSIENHDVKMGVLSQKYDNLRAELRIHKNAKGHGTDVERGLDGDG